jgi:hypothetical protein
MISVVLYGRNDSHGYNLHKRAAISLNCIAEMLSDDDDEILFVDYNTPNDLPTFIEAIYDTLTPESKKRLRVLRVRPEVHARIAAKSHLLALEPHARNIAIRRANPRNRWMLMTNTDMIFIPREGSHTLSSAAEDLADGHYLLPRFELPEPLWESFPRTDPHAVMQACRDLGPKLHLDEVTTSHPYMRYDSPGDFQLIPRRALFEIHGFDERMIYGWHADSNMCKRLYLYHGNRTESLAHCLKGYHCDHTRVATGVHRQDLKPENDLYQFVYRVVDPVAPGQADSWGAPNINIEEVDFSDGLQARYITALTKALGGAQAQDYHSDANDATTYVEYASKHVLPYVAGNLTVYPRNARFVYVGANDRLLGLLTTTVAEMGFHNPVHYVPDVLGKEMGGAVPVTANGGEGQLADALSEYDLVLFDVGLDWEGERFPNQPARITDWPRENRYRIGRVIRLIKSFAEVSKDSSCAGRGTAEALLINVNHYLLRRFVSHFLMAVETPYNTRTMKGRPRVGMEKRYRSASWKVSEDFIRAFFGYDNDGYAPAVIQPGTAIDFSATGNASAYKNGHWGALDVTGCWTDGTTAELVLPFSEEHAQSLLLHIRIRNAFIGVNKEAIRIVATFEGEQVGRWLSIPGYSLITYKGLLPDRLIQGKRECRLRIDIENPQSVQAAIEAAGKFQIGKDYRQLGVLIESVSFASTDNLRFVYGQKIDFTRKGTGMNHMIDYWTAPDHLGAWSLGQDCQLMFTVDEQPEDGTIAKFTITDVAVNETHPNLNVDITINGRKLAVWEMGPYRGLHERSIFIPPEVMRVQNPLRICFHIDEPRSPHELGWTTGDLRPLGFRLTNFRLDRYEIPKLKLGESVDFTSGGRGTELLRGVWSKPDNYGAWTMGEQAALQIRLEDVPKGPVPAAFVVSDCVVAESAPNLSVTVEANGHEVGDWKFGPERTPHVRTVELPEAAISPSGAVNLTFHVAQPRTPSSLGWSDDKRPLGIRLTRALFGSRQVEIPQFAQTTVAERNSTVGNLIARVRAAVGGRG